MKFYWVLGWWGYYPEGGLDNVSATFDNEYDALLHAETLSHCDFVEVIDIRDKYL